MKLRLLYYGSIYNTKSIVLESYELFRTTKIFESLELKSVHQIAGCRIRIVFNKSIYIYAKHKCVNISLRI